MNLEQIFQRYASDYRCTIPRRLPGCVTVRVNVLPRLQFRLHEGKLVDCDTCPELGPDPQYFIDPEDLSAYLKRYSALVDDYNKIKAYIDQEFDRWGLATYDFQSFYNFHFAIDSTTARFYFKGTNNNFIPLEQRDYQQGELLTWAARCMRLLRIEYMKVYPILTYHELQRELEVIDPVYIGIKDDTLQDPNLLNMILTIVGQQTILEMKWVEPRIWRPLQGPDLAIEEILDHTEPVPDWVEPG